MEIPLVGGSVHKRFTAAALTWEMEGWGTEQLRKAMSNGIWLTWDSTQQMDQRIQGWEVRNKAWGQPQTEAINNWVQEALRLDYTEVSKTDH